ncbi:class I SAM-dependent methyltransferase [Algiphilus sp. NNCM1]|uniref:class I SAM-dependent methyltransferase n=1 Tax=Algiphilus sp. TaxID=1872431 RepID=UPI001CA69E5F|nr:class I SAM-dependent methyltransferase [Algiphilus sp.]MBY8965039.1 class I SAM-dependent methyltransferase [Algiphilus acroporae]MCI5104195.1 class I SAM-dependent methyltransferase [Algiphilus sp.]
MTDIDTEGRTVRQSPTQRGGFLQPKWKANSKSHSRRSEAILRHAAGRKCLDVGCASGVHGQGWLHASLAAGIDDLTGIDIDKEGVELANRKGYRCLVANAESFVLEDSFDLVIAGELIEHLSNPGGFLDSARKCLRPEGQVLITTPNAFAVSNFVYRLAGDVRVNADHVAWYCPITLSQLFERHGYNVEVVECVDHIQPSKLRRVAANLVRSVVPGKMKWGTILLVARIVE